LLSLTVAMALVLVASACGTAPAATSAAPLEAIKIKAPYTAISVAQSPVWVAKEAGLFDKYGLDAELDYIRTSTTLTSAMLSGEVQIAAAAEEAVISADLGGADLVMIASGPIRLLFSIYVKAGINSVSDLKGKKLGVTRTGASTDFAARYVLTHNNLSPERDVSILQMNGVPEILAGLKAGAIDAGVLSPPTTFTAKKAGFKELIDVSQQDLAFYQGPIIVRKSWLKDHREEARRYLKAYCAAIALMHRDATQAKAVISKYSKQTDPEILSDSLAALLRILPVDQTPQLAAVRTGLEQTTLTNPKAKDADPKQFIDASLMQELVKSGFISGLK
jgi:ABC-type nitrate/sulfonate/bicarbonate transport system substrate-binding protein